MGQLPSHDEEKARLAALRSYRLLDSPCEEIFDNLVEVAATVCHVPVSLINLVDEFSQFTKSSFGMQIRETPREIAFCSHTIQGPDILEVQDTKNDARFRENPYVTHEPAIRFYAGVPLTTPEGQRIGTLCVLDHAPGVLTEEQKKLLFKLSRVVMQLFELKKSIAEDVLQRNEISAQLESLNHQLEKGLSQQKKNNRMLLLFSKMSDMLQACLTFEEAFSVISSFTQKIFPEAAGAIYLLSQSREHLESMLAWKNPASSAEFFAIEDCWAMRYGEHYLVRDMAVDLVCAHRNKNGLKNMTHICLPLRAHSETLGLLCLENIARTGNGKNRILYVVRMAEQIALCLANIKLKALLRHQSTCDPLTGLYNRRYLAECFRREQAHALRTGTQIGLILFDVDFFKKFNDKYGHDAGDLVLTTIAEILKKNSRRYDIPCRLGGEEFLLMMRDINEPDIRQRAETLRQQIQQSSLKYHEMELDQLTVSLGLALYPLHGETLDELILAADRALYKAKKTGRNRAILFQQ